MDKIIEILSNTDWVTILAFLAALWIYNKRLDKKFQKIDDKFEKLDEKIEAQGNNLRFQMDKLESSLNSQMCKLDEKVTDIDRRLCRLEGAFILRGAQILRFEQRESSRGCTIGNDPILIATPGL